MGLDEWLAALRTCPSNQLNSQFGITYDWPILLRADFDHVMQGLVDSPQWQSNPESSRKFDLKELGGHKVAFFDYVSGSASVMVQEGIVRIPANEQVAEHINQQVGRGNYSMSLLLGWGDTHPEDKRVWAWRTLALAIDDLTQHIQTHKIPAYFPWARGPGTAADLPGVVYEPLPSTP